ncbi:MAG: hypothetical protein JXK94_14850 [Deltaproteobacteria bacterium]|nr:hypothetical protein [Deltaproteobacteria bacterium]
MLSGASVLFTEDRDWAVVSAEFCHTAVSCIKGFSADDAAITPPTGIKQGYKKITMMTRSFPLKLTRPHIQTENIT